jgi:hypothetical protein
MLIREFFYLNLPFTAIDLMFADQKVPTRLQVVRQVLECCAIAQLCAA